jgi:DNA-binding beta-propeller fold protein YncE
MLKTMVKDNRLAVPVLCAALMLGAAAILFAIGGCRNHRPATPAGPAGPDTGLTRWTYDFTIVADCPTDESRSYRCAWGDGDTSGWSPLAINGDTVTLEHAWAALGEYAIRVQARDQDARASDWSDSCSFRITTPGYLHQVVDTIREPDGSPLTDWTISSDGRVLYLIASWSGRLFAVSTVTESVIAAVALPPVAWEFDIHLSMPDQDDRLCAAPGECSEMWCLRTSDNVLTDTIRFGRDAGVGTAVSSHDGEHIYVSAAVYPDTGPDEGQYALYKVRSSDNAVIDTTAIPTEADRAWTDNILVLTGDSVIYILPKQGSPQTLALRTADLGRLDTLLQGHLVFAGVQSRNTGLVYLATEDNVLVADPSSNTIVDSMATGAAPREGTLVLSPDGEYLYVTTAPISPGGGNTSLSVIRLATKQVVDRLPNMDGEFLVSPDGSRGYLRRDGIEVFGY